MISQCKDTASPMHPVERDRGILYMHMMYVDCAKTPVIEVWLVVVKNVSGGHAWPIHVEGQLQ